MGVMDELREMKNLLAQKEDIIKTLKHENKVLRNQIATNQVSLPFHCGFDLDGFSTTLTCIVIVEQILPFLTRVPSPSTILLLSILT